MPAARYDLKRENNLGVDAPIEQGKRFTLSITATLDMTDYSARAKVRTAWVGGSVILDFASYITITPGSPTSTLVIDVPASITAGLQARTEELERELGSDYKPGVYDLEVEDGSGNVDGWLYGEEVEITPEAAR